MAETKNNETLEDYKHFLSELIEKQMLIIGPQIGLDKAKRIPGLTVDEAGKVVEISGDAYLVVKNLIDEYSSLSQPITQSVLCLLVEKYPKIKDAFGHAITKIELYCPVTL